MPGASGRDTACHGGELQQIKEGLEMILKAIWNIGKDPLHRYRNDAYMVDDQKAVAHNGMHIVHDGIRGYFVYAGDMIFTNRVGFEGCKQWIDDFQRAGGVKEYFSRVKARDANAERYTWTEVYDMLGHW